MLTDKNKSPVEKKVGLTFREIDMLKRIFTGTKAEDTD